MGFGIGELIVLLLIVVLVFGASKLPQLGDALGRSIKNFKRAVNDKDRDEIDITPRKELPESRSDKDKAS